MTLCPASFRRTLGPISLAPLHRAARLHVPPRSHFQLLQTRTMAAAAATSRKYEWLVVVPDKPGTRAKRLEVRPTHFANMKPWVESGQWKMGGTVLDSVPQDDEPSSLGFVGSSLIVVAESEQAVLDMLKGDIYTTSGVWDLEKVQMWPFKCAFRYPPE